LFSTAVLLGRWGFAVILYSFDDLNTATEVCHADECLFAVAKGIALYIHVTLVFKIC
jgi:hypothetical protein